MVRECRECKDYFWVVRGYDETLGFCSKYDGQLSHRYDIIGVVSKELLWLLCGKETVERQDQSEGEQLF